MDDWKTNIDEMNLSGTSERGGYASDYQGMNSIVPVQYLNRCELHIQISKVESNCYRYSEDQYVTSDSIR